MRNCFALLVGLGLTTSVVACGSSDKGKGGGGNNLNSDGGGGDGGSGATTPGFDKAGAAELKATNVGKYIGQNVPASHTSAGNVTDYTFDAKGGDGPICMWEGAYHVFVRDKGSDNVIIYLQGGGACWTGFCEANTTATASITATGILDDQATTNSVADWNVVYAPYCDGSVFSGDNDVANPTPGAGETALRHQRGIRNLTAAIDLAKAQYPNAKRILLAGSSAGGYGTLGGAGVVRLEFPTTPLIVFNDSGVGLTNGADSDKFKTQAADWKYTQFLPPSCTECAAGDLTALIGWGLQHDPTLRVAAFSSYDDAVIGGVFLGITGQPFKDLLLSQTGAVHDKYPTRFERFFIDGSAHTTLIANTVAGGGGYNTPVNGETVATWTKDFVDGTADWTDRLESADGG